MTDAPAPLTAAEVDLRDFPFMPLDVQRLFNSETWVLATAEEKVAALTLWGRSWHERPAASLPEDDRMLAHLSGAGARWKRVKEMALRGWVKCSDGRLYHPVVAEKANDAWEQKCRQRDRGRKGNAVRWGSPEDRGGIARGSPDDPTTIAEGSPDDRKGQGQGQGQGERERQGSALSRARGFDRGEGDASDDRAEQARARQRQERVDRVVAGLKARDRAALGELPGADADPVLPAVSSGDG